MSTLKKAVSYGVTVTTILWSVGLMATPLAVGAAQSGDLIKLQCSAGAGVNDPCRAVYYLGADGKRYVFPNEKTYKTWYPDFSGVQIVSSTEMSSYPIGGNVTYRPGVMLVKITTDPKVYAVSQNGTLHWVTTGDIAEALYGANWAQMIEDVPDAFFVNYTIGSDINNAGDYDKNTAMNDSTSINVDKSLTTGGGGGSTSTGSSLSVALASDTPAAALAVPNAARLPYTKLNVTASADGDIIIDSMKVRLFGSVDSSGSKTAYTGIDLVDGRNMLPFDTNSKTFNSENTATFTRDIRVPAGTTLPLYVTANMAGTAAMLARSGEQHGFQVTEIMLKGGTVIGSLPISGNLQTINSTLSIASATVSRGGFSNSSTTSSNPTEVGTTNFSFFSFKIQAGSEEHIQFNTLRIYMVGSASFGDLENVALYKDGTKLVDGVIDSNDSKYMNFFMPAGVTINEGQTAQFQIKGDVIDGSGRTLQLAINRTTDLLVMGTASGFNAVPTYSGTGSSSDTPALTDNEFTIGGGSVVVSKSNDVPAGNITIGDNQEFGAFKFRVDGEPVEVSAMTLTVESTTTGTIIEDATRSYKVLDSNGNVVAGPTDITDHTLEVRFSDTFTVPVGEHVYRVVANFAANSGFTTNSTLTVSVTPSTGLTLRGETTGDTLTASPGAAITGNQRTIKTGTVTVTRNGVPSDATYIAGASQALFGAWTFDGTDSGEDTRITSIGIAASATNVNNLTLYFDGVAQTPVNDDPASDGTRNTSTFTLNTPLIVTKGDKVQVELRGDISSAAITGEVSQFGITSDDALNATGVSTGNTLTADVTADDGAVIEYSDAGTLTLANFNTPEKELVLSGSTGYTVNSLRLSATNEDIVLDELTVRVSDADETGTEEGDYKDIANVAIYNGATKLVESNVPSTGFFKFNFSQNPANVNYVKVPKDGNVTLTVKIDTAQITTQGTDNPGTPNAGFVVGSGGVNGIKGTGADSGSTAGETYNTSTSTAKVLHTSVPKVTLPSSTNRLGAASTLTNGDIRLFAFDVTADSAQSRSALLYRTTFGIATTDGVEITSFYMKQEGVGDKISEADVALATWIGSSGRVAIEFNSPLFSSPTGDADEYIEVSAGTTKRFYLHGTVASAAAGDSVTVRLLGDTASSMTNNLTGAAAQKFAGVKDQAGLTGAKQGKFVWSDDHLNVAGSATATTSAMWFNGHLVSGLEKTVTTTGYTISF